MGQIILSPAMVVKAVHVLHNFLTQRLFVVRVEIGDYDDEYHRLFVPMGNIGMHTGQLAVRDYLKHYFTTDAG